MNFVDKITTYNEHKWCQINFAQNEQNEIEKSWICPSLPLRHTLLP